MTKTSKTYSLSTITREALLDELSKIAEAKKDTSIKKILKNVALASLGGAAGTGAAMLGHKFLQSVIGPKYEKFMPTTKMRIVAPLLGISTSALLATTLALQKEMAKPEEAESNV